MFEFTRDIHFLFIFVIFYFYQRNLQLSVLGVMCNYGNADCINQAKEYFDNWLQKGTEYIFNLTY